MLFRLPSLVLAVFVAGLLLGGSPARAKSPWGRDYFPNMSLTTHDGKTVRFFDDLIEGKIVVINFIYTRCKDTCPLETAQLLKVREILGDRVGKDIFFYSITLEPGYDTPEVLKKYREQFNADWMFLTGDQEEIFDLQKKLGLFLEEIREGLSNHNLSMIIGNQATGRWMKRAPFENPYVLADQVGNWLDGWKRPPELDSYLNAPKLRNVPQGEQLFRTRCASCHTISGQQARGALGPDLLGVTRRREPAWLINWLRAPDQMLRDKDPIAMALFESYKRLPMPNLRLNQEEAIHLMDYLEAEALRILGRPEDSLIQVAGQVSREAAAAVKGSEESSSELLVVLNGWIRAAHPASRVNYGYLTLANPGNEEVKLVGLESPDFRIVKMSELTEVDGFKRRSTRSELVIPARGQVELKPGGLHLICADRQQTIEAGQEAELTLTFKSGQRQNIRLDVFNERNGEVFCPGCIKPTPSVTGTLGGNAALLDTSVRD